MAPSRAANRTPGPRMLKNMHTKDYSVTKREPKKNQPQSKSDRTNAEFGFKLEVDWYVLQYHAFVHEYTKGKYFVRPPERIRQCQHVYCRRLQIEGENVFRLCAATTESVQLPPEDLRELRYARRCCMDRARAGPTNWEPYSDLDECVSDFAQADTRRGGSLRHWLLQTMWEVYVRQAKPEPEKTREEPKHRFDLDEAILEAKRRFEKILEEPKQEEKPWMACTFLTLDVVRSCLKVLEVASNSAELPWLSSLEWWEGLEEPKHRLNVDKVTLEAKPEQEKKLWKACTFRLLTLYQ